MTNNTQGILWALLATGLFSVVAAMAKVAVNEFHVLQVLFFRQIVVFLSALPTIARTFPNSLRTKHPGIHLLRLTGAFIALSCGIWAVAVLPLTTATTLAFAQVFFVALLAYWFLGEPVGIQRVTAIIIGFFGVLIVMRPGVGGFIEINAFIPILGAIGASIAKTCVRKLSQTEATATLMVYQAVFVGVLAGVPLFWLWVTPDLAGLLLLLSTGVVASMGQWVGVKALRLGEASVVGNIQYSTLVYAALFGYILFGEVPDRYTLVGAGVIIASSIYIFRLETLKKKPAR